MPYEESVTAWLSKLKRGQSTAAEQIWQRYVERLVRLARSKLRGSPRRVADEEDVALVAFDAFLRGVKEGRFARLEDRDDLWQLLLMLTDRKAISLRRRERALRRGGGAVRGESAFAASNGNGSRQIGLDHVAAPEPSPQLALEMAQQVRELLDRLDETQQRIALGKLAGYTNPELAERLDISRRSVERKLSIIRGKCEAESP